MRPLPHCLGAEIICDDLKRIDDAEAKFIYQAWHDHLALLFPGQRLSDDDLVAFTLHFGTLKDPLPTHQREAGAELTGHPNVSVISNVVENGVAIGVLGDGEARWHTDYNFNERPYAATTLYALEIPPTGGRTGWSNMYAAYETLDAGLRARIQNLTIKHDETYNAAGMLRRGYEPEDDIRISPGPTHPIVRTHPETGHNFLYLGRRLRAYVNGLELSESEELLDALWAHAEKPEFQWMHDWRVGDLILWDNRCTMHYREAFPSSSRRIMHKTQTVGDRPVFQPSANALGAHPRASLGIT
ncbi:MAG: TauD/TfdA family dioxygenase [Rhizobiales bacterium]|nr:TauD/TfdA family dioxygenase [Hyphomicrobiales bacterium]